MRRRGSGKVDWVLTIQHLGHHRDSFPKWRQRKTPQISPACFELGQEALDLLGDTYINGFLIKDVKIQHLVTENVNLTLEEVTKFTAGAEDGTENLDLAALAASLKTTPLVIVTCLVIWLRSMKGNSKVYAVKLSRYEVTLSP
jgi:hypothetical protein